MWVGIVRVKNESDIIEAFVRHTICHVDTLIVIDHASTDRTAAILDCLRAEGLPLEVLRSNVFEPQGLALTRLMRRAFLDLGADWVVPLDADEFIESSDGAMLRTRAASQVGETLEVFWDNFLYVPGRCNDADLLARMHWRSNVRSELPKVVIPRAVGVDPGIAIYEGSHFVARGGEILRGRPANDTALCHFPIRSLDQYRLKVVIGTLRYIIDPARDGETWGWHYQRAYDLIVADRIEDLEALMQEESLLYSTKKTQATPIFRPFTRLGGDLRYTAADEIASPVASLAQFAEGVARELRRARTPKPLRARLLEILRSRSNG